MNKPFRTGFTFGLRLFLAEAVLIVGSAYALNGEHCCDRIKRKIQRIRKAQSSTSNLEVNQNGRKRVIGFTVE